MTSRVFEEIDADAAMDRECPHCQAPPHRWCKWLNGETRPIPCIARMRMISRSADRTRQSPPSPLDVEPLTAPARPTRSFSEPIHQPETEQ